VNTNSALLPSVDTAAATLPITTPYNHGTGIEMVGGHHHRKFYVQKQPLSPVFTMAAKSGTTVKPTSSAYKRAFEIAAAIANTNSVRLLPSRQPATATAPQPLINHGTGIGNG
jgi:hypothetical protein